MKLKLLTASIAFGFASLSAQAAFLSGTVSLGAVTGTINQTPSGQFVNNATAITFADLIPNDGKGDLVVNGVSAGSSFEAIGMAAVDLAFINTNPWSFGPTLFGFYGPGASLTFTTTLLGVSGSSVGQSHFLNVAGVGFWHDASNTYADTAGAFSLSFTQTGQNPLTDEISVSGTLSAFQRQRDLPEPATALLAGLGLLGIAGIRRAKKA
ncbi:MAG: PEP-CTERM sorting domain-containing protein [Candidatus Accumulibacter sp.]|nr:PEP-CTERM sorting domain-containing protein [Accumulibacter sp.]